MARSSGTWKKGQGGKPKGALNRTTKEAHELFIMIMNGQVEKIEQKLKEIDDAEKYIGAISKLFQYYIPRKTDVTSDGQSITPQMPTVIIKTKKNGD